MKGCECHAGLARTPTGGVETVVAVGAPSRADGSFGAWLRPWSIVFCLICGRVGVLSLGWV